jgi:hypothetical protein
MTDDLDAATGTPHSSHGHPILRPYQFQTFVPLMTALPRYRGETFTVLFPRQAGKNEVAAAVTAALLVEHAARGGSVVVCAPTFEPQAGISVERVRAALRRLAPMLPRGVVPRFSGGRVEAGLASAVFLGASPAAHVAGHTASLALVADEAQEIDEGWFDRQFRPMAASTAAPTLLFGTPWDGNTLLDKAVARNRERDARLNAGAEGGPSRLHYEASWRDVADGLPAYGDYVRGQRELLGAAHPLFLTQYGLRTVEAAGRLFGAEALAALEGTHARLHTPLPGERYVGGLDLAGDGEEADATVLTIARVSGGRCEVVQHVRWQGAAYTPMLAGVVAAAKQWRFERLCVDATGLGGPLTARLGEQLGAMVERLPFSAQSKSELGYGLLAAAGTDRLALYANDHSPEAVACRVELRACESSSAGASRMRWGAARDHDDFVVSLALCLRAAESLGAPRVALGRRRE